MRKFIGLHLLPALTECFGQGKNAGLLLSLKHSAVISLKLDPIRRLIETTSSIRPPAQHCCRKFLQQRYTRDAASGSVSGSNSAYPSQIGFL